MQTYTYEDVRTQYDDTNKELTCLSCGERVQDVASVHAANVMAQAHARVCVLNKHRYANMLRVYEHACASMGCGVDEFDALNAYLRTPWTLGTTHERVGADVFAMCVDLENTIGVDAHARAFIDAVLEEVECAQRDARACMCVCVQDERCTEPRAQRIKSAQRASDEVLVSVCARHAPHPFATARGE